MRAAASRSTLNVPTRLIRTTRSKASSGSTPERPTTRPAVATPAQLTTTRNGPRASARSSAAEIAASSVTSAGAKTAASPIAAAACSRSPPGRSTTTTFAPAAASRVAVARPRPEAPPVTRATASLISMGSVSQRGRGRQRCVRQRAGLLRGVVGVLLRGLGRPVARRRVLAGAAVTVTQVDRDGVPDGHQRHREERADDPGDEDAGADGEDDGERVDLDGAPQQEGLQHVRLHLLHEDDRPEHDQRDDRAMADERDEDGDDPGDEGADDRHERPEEHEDADRHGERHAQDRRGRTDTDRVDRRDDHSRTHVGGESGPGVHGRAVDPRPGPAGEEPDDEAPDLVARREEEEGAEQGDEEAAGDVGGGGGDPQRAGDQTAAVRADALLRLVDEAVDLVGRDVQRAVRQHVAQVVQALRRLLLQAGEARRHLLPDEADEARDHEQDDQDGQDRRERGPQAEAPDAELLQGLDQRHDEKSDQDGHDEDLELREQQEQQVDAAGHGDDPPRPRGGGPQAQGHELTVTRALLRRRGLHDEGSSWGRSGGRGDGTVRSPDPTASPGRSHGDQYDVRVTPLEHPFDSR